MPAGSGNGLAAALGTPRDPDAALQVLRRSTPEPSTPASWPAVLSSTLPASASTHGSLDFSTSAVPAGVAPGRMSRSASVKVGDYEGIEYPAHLDGERQRVRAFLIAFANGREYGMGARIAPLAELDDGRLDATIVEYRPHAGAVLGCAPPRDGDRPSRPSVTDQARRPSRDRDRWPDGVSRGR